MIYRSACRVQQHKIDIAEKHRHSSVSIYIVILENKELKFHVRNLVSEQLSDIAICNFQT